MGRAGARTSLWDGWVRQARELDARGHFQKYSAKQRREVLAKGYLGAVPPDQALGEAIALVDAGHYFQTPKFVDELRAYGVVGSDEIREVLLEVLQEVPGESYRPPAHLEDPPGSPFHFHCTRLGRRIYFKFQLKGTAKKRQIVFWSCHDDQN